MFNTKEPADCVGFDSQWKVKKITVQSSIQTEPIMTENTSISTTNSTNTPVQTEEEEVKPPVYDEQRLADFLKRLYPKVSKELNEAASSQVFKNYHADGPCNKVQPKLVKAFKLTPESGEYNKTVSSLSWNCTGNKLAVSVVQDHETWCHHNGMIFISSFYGKSSDNEEKLLQIKTPSCNTAIKYHPILPPILAVGSYTGELLVLNTQNDENEQLLVKNTGHDNLITQIEWVEDLDTAKNYVMVSGSIDGCLKIWSFNMATNELNLKEIYKIKTPLFGRMQRRGEIPSAIAKKVDRGIVSFDFSTHSPEKFVVAAEGGLIAQCSRLGTKALPETAKDIRVSDPVYKYYRAHEGEITSIALSPDRPDLFATNASDGEIRVYDTSEEEPGKVINTRNGTLFVAWVPYSQNLLAACGEHGRIDFFNARNGQLMNPITSTEKDDKPLEETCFTNLAFHKGKISVVAVGTKDGGVQIWDIPWNSY